ncbi:MAG: hypothetical protein US60_C0002G0020 [Microgenomates group bacterium GW2011_GWC1_37_8]|uniref:Uncharacterized protein n=1 Tax=Candidatus Woesebacteria bacterium GW2011_GWB1_38_8 TaxID=1618570 RepID=A0A0G0L0I9_9BACT|nr:MAG: hypothetical protein US60_C0002G0020 [Microgenomates group bacterium GW2011_GWC1_37_8]KKQ85458.1 MAG: hypothetical protein UT08_C0006G0041 [Candidatus Woesebacteria bacterium GW2011_GWB1_38_8]
MSNCCGSCSKTEKTKKDAFGEKPPKSFTGKFLYNIGKKEFDKENQNKPHGKKCC